jgi:hypothetical protein
MTSFCPKDIFLAIFNQFCDFLSSCLLPTSGPALFGIIQVDELRLGTVRVSEKSELFWQKSTKDFHWRTEESVDSLIVVFDLSVRGRQGVKTAVHFISQTCKPLVIKCKELARRTEDTE